MFEYRYEAMRDGDGWLITFPDFTGVNTEAQSEDSARDALLTMLEHSESNDKARACTPDQWTIPRCPSAHPWHTRPSRCSGGVGS